MKNNLVTIVITTWNSIDHLRLCIASIFQGIPLPLTVLVVNNGSTDGTTEYLHSASAVFPSLFAINNNTNRGVIAALAQAERFIESKYVICMNDDIVVGEGWLEGLIKVYESDSQIRAVSPAKISSKFIHPYTKTNSRLEWESVKARYPNAGPRELLDAFQFSKSIEEFGRDLAMYNGISDTYLECPPDFNPGCCVLMEMDFMRSIGGLVDERFKMYGGEDVDRSWRIAAAGYLCLKTSRVYIHHFEGTSIKKNGLKWQDFLRVNNKILLGKWRAEILTFIGNTFKSGLSIDELLEKYWLINRFVELDNTLIKESLYRDRSLADPN